MALGERACDKVRDCDCEALRCCDKEDVGVAAPELVLDVVGLGFCDADIDGVTAPLAVRVPDPLPEGAAVPVVLPEGVAVSDPLWVWL